MPTSSNTDTSSISLSNDNKKQANDFSHHEIPESSQQLVQERFDEYKQNPQDALNWEDFEKTLL